MEKEFEGDNLKENCPWVQFTRRRGELPLSATPNLMRGASLRPIKLQLDMCSLQLEDTEDLPWLLYGKAKGAWVAQREQKRHCWSGRWLPFPLTVSSRCTNPRVGESDSSNLKSFPRGPQRDCVCSRLLRDSLLGWGGGEGSCRRRHYHIKGVSVGEDQQRKL